MHPFPQSRIISANCQNILLSRLPKAATTDQILPMVEYNLGIGFYPEELARDALKSRTVCRIPLIEEAPKREICLIINPRQHQNAAAKELIGELLERV